MENLWKNEWGKTNDKGVEELGQVLELNILLM